MCIWKNSEWKRKRRQKICSVVNRKHLFSNLSTLSLSLFQIGILATSDTTALLLNYYHLSVTAFSYVIMLQLTTAKALSTWWLMILTTSNFRSHTYFCLFIISLLRLTIIISLEVATFEIGKKLAKRKKSAVFSHQKLWECTVTVTMTTQKRAHSLGDKLISKNVRQKRKKRRHNGVNCFFFPYHFFEKMPVSIQKLFLRFLSSYCY